MSCSIPNFRCFLLLMLLGMLGMHSGCHWNPFKRTTGTPSPVLFAAGQPTFEELAMAVNSNANRIRELSSQGATLRVAGAPAVNADIALERPLGFRFRAQTTLTGAEADIGSNNELFWFWIARSPQPALFFARHDQFANSSVRSQLPISPTWIIDAIGLTEINLQQTWEGPIPIGADQLEIRTKVASPVGELTKSIVLHNRFGWIMQQKITDPQGQLVALANTSKHEYYEVDNVSLPQHLEMNLPALQGAFTIDVDRWQVNALSGDPQTLFALPRDQLRSYPLVDIAAPQNPSMPTQPPGNPAYPVSAPYGPPPGAGAYLPTNMQPRISARPEDDYRQRIRGLNSHQ